MNLEIFRRTEKVCDQKCAGLPAHSCFSHTTIEFGITKVKGFCTCIFHIKHKHIGCIFIIPDGCVCDPGWLGPDCDESCPAQYYGMGCKHRCRCENGGTCHHTDGTCTCQPGYTGGLCDKGIK